MVCKNCHSYFDERMSEVCPTCGKKPDWMGGWLLFIVVMSYIACAFFGVVLIAFSWLMLRSMSMVAGAYKFLFFLLMAIGDAYVAVIIWLGLRYLSKLRKGESDFLRAYQIMVAFQIVMLLLAFMSNLRTGNFSGIRFFNGILSAALLIGTHLYFVRSERVFRYMGGGDYIGRAIFQFGAMPHESHESHKTPQFCSQCGAPLNSGAQFCGKCGNPVR